MKALAHPSYPSTTIYVPDLDAKSALQILGGRFNFARDKSEPQVRRLLDLAPHCGIFAAWFYSRFSYAWIDMVESDEDRQKMCVLNAPPGARVVKNDVAGFVAEVRGAKRELAFDAVHGAWASLPVDDFHWPALKLAIVEHDHGDLHEVASCFSDFSLVAADRGFTAWVRS